VKIKERYPSKEFYNKVKIEGLYKEWFISFNLSYYNSLHSGGKKFKKININKLYKQHITDNSELTGIIVNDEMDKLYVLAGVISKFNYDDIKYFTENSHNIILYNIMNSDFYLLIEQIYGVIPEWVISPKTIELLKIELDLK